MTNPALRETIVQPGHFSMTIPGQIQTAINMKGVQIPLEGRITAVADVFDALCAARPYKAAWSLDDAYQEIARGSGTHFDPSCVAAFQLKWPEIVNSMPAACIAA